MKEIINKLRYFDENFPRDVIEECVSRQEESTEILLEELDKVIIHKELATENEDYMLHLYAVYLLAQFKEKRAFSKVIDLISFRPDEVDTLFGDVLTEDVPAIIYSTYDGNLALLQGVMENPSLSIYARGTVLSVYGKLYSDGVIGKDECIGYLRKLIYDDAFDIDHHMGTEIQGIVIERHIFEMIDDIQYLYDQDCIDAGMFGEYDDFIDIFYAYDDKERIEYIDDTSKSMSWWACFKQTDGQENRMEALIKQLMDSQDDDDERFSKKVGRNEPCPCGSGKKHKKCCLGKEPSAEEERAREEKRLLEYYPSIEGEKVEGQIRITDIFDEKSIEIDRLVYLGVHSRRGSFWDDEDELDNSEEIGYLVRAYEEFMEKCRREEIDSFDLYDSKYKIHYKSREWIERFKDLIIKNEHDYYFGDLLESVQDMISNF